MGKYSEASQEIIDAQNQEIEELRRRLAERDKDDGRSSRSSMSSASKYSRYSLKSQQLLEEKDRQREVLEMQLRRANAELEAQQKIDRVTEAYRQSLELIAAKEQ
jgi:hypothetical protein